MQLAIPTMTSVTLDDDTHHGFSAAQMICGTVGVCLDLIPLERTTQAVLNGVINLELSTWSN